MSAAALELFPDTPPAREELAGFLAAWIPAQDGLPWARRLAHWWTQNPAAATNPVRGYWARENGRIVGYGGSIPAEYALEGHRLPALWATSMVTAPRHPAVAAKIFLNQRHFQHTHLICHSTPNARVQDALVKMGARQATRVTRHFFAVGPCSMLRGRHGWPALPQDRTLVTDLARVTALARAYQRAERIEKWVTVESLRWYCDSPMRRHHFVGLVDRHGVLDTYLLLTPRSARGIRMYDVIEAFTTQEDDAPLHALLGALVRDPGLLPGPALALSTTTFEDDPRWRAAPALLRRQRHLNHFFLMPEGMQTTPKHHVVAEGDWGL